MSWRDCKDSNFKDLLYDIYMTLITLYKWSPTHSQNITRLASPLPYSIQDAQHTRDDSLYDFVKTKM